MTKSRPSILGQILPEGRSIERLLVHLSREHQAMLYVMLEADSKPDEVNRFGELSPLAVEHAELMKRIEMWVHADGRMDFDSHLVPSARVALDVIR